MNAEETTRLIEVIESLCPAQQFADETAALWSVALARVPLADAVAVAPQVAGRKPFIDLNDIVQGTRALRRDRLERLGKVTPNVDPADARAWAAELRALTAGVGDGTVDPDHYDGGGYTLTGAKPMRTRAAAVEAFPGKVKAIAASVERSLPRPPLSGPEYGAKKPPAPNLSPSQTRAAEAERDRQLAELARAAQVEAGDRS